MFEEFLEDRHVRANQVLPILPQPMRQTPVLLLLLPFLFVAACDGPAPVFGEPRRLSRDERPTVWNATTRDRLGVAEMNAPRAEPVKYVATTPEGWEERESEPQRFRNLVWGIPGDADTECWLTAGVGGGVAGNLVRWYGQFGMPAGSPDALVEVTFAGQPGHLLELSGSYGGKPGTTMMVAFISNGQQVTSLKMIAPIEVARANRDKFLALTASVRKAGGSSGAGGPAGGNQNQEGQMPEDQTHQGAGQQAAAADPFVTEVPAGWTRKAESQRPLHHTFGTDGEVYVSQLSGAIRPMLDIWRAEVGQQTAMTEAEFAALPTCEMLGAGALWLDATGDYTSMTGKQIPNARIIVVVRNDGGTITFVKLVGRAADVEAEVEGFRTFCATMRRNS